MIRRALLLAAALLVLAVSSAHAAFPGANGKIAFVSNADGDSEIYSINPDGSGLVQLTHNAIADLQPSWSPSGQKIAFLRVVGSDRDIWVMNADGSGQALVLDYPGAPGYAPNTPAWSPDGAKIVFGVTDSDNRGVCNADSDDDVCGLFTVNPDGTALQELVLTLSDSCCPSWSSDGTRVAFSSGEFGLEGTWNILVKTIGGGVTTIATPPTFYESSLYPDWSPSGHKIDFAFLPETGGSYVYAMNPDGSAKTQGHEGAAPVWSPDSERIAFLSNGPPSGVWVGGSPLGTGATFVTAGDAAGGPDWQPIPINSYPRPKGATPSRFSLVPAYLPCTTSNRTHGPPLAFPSCNPPLKNSPYLTVPAPDSNGAPVAFEGSLRTVVVVGNPATPADEADVTLSVSGSDVRCDGSNPPATCGAPNVVSGIPDYTGELEAVLFLRITDKDNTPAPSGPGAATVEDFDLHVSVPCTGTASTSAGSTCATTTSIDALIPGAVKEGKRAIWQLDRVRVCDGGADGDVDTGGNTLFATQGLFVP